MPKTRRTQKKSEQAFADVWLDRFRSAQDERLPRVEAWDKSYRDHDPRYIDRTKVQRPPYVKFPYLHRVTESQTTILMDATDAAGRWLYANPTTKGFEDVSEAVTDWLDYQFRRKSADLNDNNRAAIKRWANMGLKYGNAYIYAQWDDFVGGVQFTSVDPYDVYLDGRKGRWYIVRRTVTLAQLGDIAHSISSPRVEEAQDPETGETLLVDRGPRDGGRALKAFKRVERLIRNGATGFFMGHHTSDREVSRRYDHDRVSGDGERPLNEQHPEDDPFNQLVDILEVYETHPRGVIAKIIPGFDESVESLVLQLERNPYGACPLVPFIPHRVDNEFYGLGNGEIVGQLAAAMDYNFRGQLSMIGSAAWPPLLFNRFANLRREQARSIYGLAIGVRDIRSDIGYMPNNISPGLHQIGLAISQQAADFATGESPQRRGMSGGASSATEAAILETAGTIQDRGVFAQWRDAQEQLGYVCLALAGIHMRKSQAVPVLGRRANDFLEIRPEFVSDVQWEVIFGGNPRASNATQQIATHMQLLQAGAVTGEVDIRAVLREMYRLSGERQPDRFLTRKDEVPALTPEEEFENLLFANQEPQVSPSENVLDHLVKHVQHAQQLADTLGADDPRTQIMLAHVQATQVAAQALFGQTPNVAGGASPLQPQQGLTSGQPSFQAATAGVNEARQSSNTAAAGQAPGGVAPRRNVGQVFGNGGVNRDRA